MTSSNGNIFRVTGPLCGEFTGPGEFPTQRPVTRNFDVFFDQRPNKRLSKQLWGWWFETLSWSLWRQRNDIMTTLRSLISLTTQLFVQHLVRVYNKENTKAPHKCPCLRRIHLSLVIAGFPLLSTSNTQIVYMTWCHYAKWSMYMGQWTGLWLAHVTRFGSCYVPVITLTNAVSFVWNKIQYNDITNISSWKKLQGRLQSIISHFKPTSLSWYIFH